LGKAGDDRLTPDNLRDPDLFDSTPYLGSILENPAAVYDRCIEFLQKYKEVDPTEYRNRRKGTHFYWAGTAAFLAHNYETAVFMYDAAVSEDIRWGSDPNISDSPALKFLYLRGDQLEQAALQLVRQTESTITNAIASYNARPGRPSSGTDLSLDHVRERFIRFTLTHAESKYRTLSTSFISFFLERDHVLQLGDLGVSQGTAEPFFLNLFKGCLLFESLLKANSRIKTSKNTLEQLLADRKIRTGLGIGSPFKISVKDFSSIPKLLPSASIETDLKLTGQMRNTLGHNLSWDFDVREEYRFLSACVASSCLHVIACLYK
jgi:hypothetical protein